MQRIGGAPASRNLPRIQAGLGPNPAWRSLGFCISTWASSSLTSEFRMGGGCPLSKIHVLPSHINLMALCLLLCCNWWQGWRLESWDSVSSWTKGAPGTRLGLDLGPPLNDSGMTCNKEPTQPALFSGGKSLILIGTRVWGFGTKDSDFGLRPEDLPASLTTGMFP